MNGPPQGHRSLPHTADIRIEAWAPTRDACLAEAGSALVDSFADLIRASAAPPERTAVVDLAGDTDEDLLLALLDEIIYRLDTEDAVPLEVRVEGRPGGVRVTMPVAAAERVEYTGAAPKAVALGGLRFTAEGSIWWCTATIDV
jgi:SHS2 domain-containing protein